MTATVVAQEGYTLGDVSTAVVVVKDDDATVARLSGPAGDVDKAGGGKVLTVALDRVLAAGESLSVPLVLGGVARLGSDYTLSAPGSLPQGVSYAHLGGSEGSSPPTLTFSGPSSAAATVRFTATEDTATEGASETVTVGLAPSLPPASMVARRDWARWALPSWSHRHRWECQRRAPPSRRGALRCSR